MIKRRTHSGAFRWKGNQTGREITPTYDETGSPPTQLGGFRPPRRIRYVNCVIGQRKFPFSFVTIAVKQAAFGGGTVSFFAC